MTGGICSFALTKMLLCHPGMLPGVTKDTIHMYCQIREVNNSLGSQDTLSHSEVNFVSVVAALAVKNDIDLYFVLN